MITSERHGWPLTRSSDPTARIFRVLSSAGGLNTGKVAVSVLVITFVSNVSEITPVAFVSVSTSVGGQLHLG